MTSGELPVNVIAAAERFPRGAEEAMSRSLHPSRMGAAALVSDTSENNVALLRNIETVPLQGGEEVLRSLLSDEIAKQDTVGLIKILTYIQEEGLNG